jgi:hypothetical protein
MGCALGARSREAARRGAFLEREWAMDVKGAVLQSLPKFVQKRFGDEGRASWMARLSPEARELFSGPILASVVYPIIPFLAEPTVVLCDCLFEGDMKGAWEAGRFSAREALSGIYRMFVVMGSPHTILKKGANAMAQLYQPSAITYMPGEGSRGVLRITTFPEPHRALDARFGGFVEESLVICGCKNPIVSMGHMMSQGYPHSEYHITWD